MGEIHRKSGHEATPIDIREYVSGFVGAILATSEHIDRNSSWLSAGIGATLALTMSNLDKTSDLIGPDSAQIFLFLLVIAVLCGLAQKTLALKIAIDLHAARSADEIVRKFKGQLDAYRAGSPPEDGASAMFDDIRRGHSAFQKMLPWSAKFEIWWIGRRSQVNPFIRDKIKIDRYHRQSIYAGLQVFFVVVSILYVATAIH